MDLFDTVSLAGSLILAIPMALLGVEFLLVRGEVPLGVTFLAVAAALVLGQHYLGAGDLSKRVAGSALERVADDVDGERDHGVGGAGGGPEGVEPSGGEAQVGEEPLIPDAETGRETVDDAGADEAGTDEEAYKS